MGIAESGIEESIIKYIDEVSKYYEIEAIIVFGSYAKGTNNKDSDIDIAFIFKNLKNDVIDEELNLMRLRR